MKYGIATFFIAGIAYILWRGEFYLGHAGSQVFWKVSRAEKPTVYWSIMFFFLAGTLGLLAVMVLQP